MRLNISSPYGHEADTGMHTSRYEACELLKWLLKRHNEWV